eukprot:4620372-Amphidinium_carterae.1
MSPQRCLFRDFDHVCGKVPPGEHVPHLLLMQHCPMAPPEKPSTVAAAIAELHEPESEVSSIILLKPLLAQFTPKPSKSPPQSLDNQL